MAEIFWLIVGIGGLGLQVLVLYTMTRGPFRTYPGVFFYLLVLFLTAVADFAAYLEPAFYETYFESYSYNNFARQFAGFVALVTLYFTATAGHPKRIGMRGRIVLSATLVTLLSFVIPAISQHEWAVVILHFGRNLAFVTVIFTLLLWFALIKSRARSRSLLLIAAGLGVNMAGESIGQSLMDLSREGRIPGLFTLGNIVAVGSHLLCLFIWFRAFCRERVEAPSSSGVTVP